MRIGEYIICKNELHHLDAWLKELIKLDVICILDTGSTDGTYEKLLELEQKYSHIHVRQKLYNPFYFDDARNDVLNFAAEYMEEGDWLFTLDLDEYASENFVDIIRPQCEAAINCNALCLRDHTGCWHWQGHRFSKNYKWFFHIHETILTLDKKEIDDNLYLQGVSYFHNQDTSKPRNYRKILKQMVDAEPNCLHYLVNMLEEERKAKENPDYTEWVRQQICYNVMNNKDDVHYHDYAYLVFAAMDAESNFPQLIKYFYEAEEDVKNGNFKESRYFHVVFAELLEKIPGNEKKIEEEYLFALMLKTDLGWWLESGSSIENILLRFLLWLFYSKQDGISAAFYAQQLYMFQSNERNIDNLIACEDINKKYLSFFWTDKESLQKFLNGITNIEKLKNLDIGVIIQKPITTEEIQFILDSGCHILLNGDAYETI